MSMCNRIQYCQIFNFGLFFTILAFYEKIVSFLIQKCPTSFFQHQKWENHFKLSSLDHNFLFLKNTIFKYVNLIIKVKKTTRSSAMKYSTVSWKRAKNIENKNNNLESPKKTMQKNKGVICRSFYKKMQ